MTYDSTAGRFTWIRKVNNGQRVLRAGATTNYGYRQIQIDGCIYKEHRLAWLWCYGKWPDKHLDHINGQTDDNRIENLRDVDCRVNRENQRKAHADSSTGVLGVTKRRKDGRFIAQIKMDGKVQYLGIFDDLTEAATVYLHTKREKHEGCTL